MGHPVYRERYIIIRCTECIYSVSKSNSAVIKEYFLLLGPLLNSHFLDGISFRLSDNEQQQRAAKKHTLDARKFPMRPAMLSLSAGMQNLIKLEEKKERGGGRRFSFRPLCKNSKHFGAKKPKFYASVCSPCKEMCRNPLS